MMRMPFAGLNAINCMNEARTPLTYSDKIEFWPATNFVIT